MNKKAEALHEEMRLCERAIERSKDMIRFHNVQIRGERERIKVIKAELAGISAKVEKP